MAALLLIWNKTNWLWDVSSKKDTSTNISKYWKQ